MVRRRLVQLLTGGKAALAQARRIDTGRPYPCVRRNPPCRGPNPVLQLSNRSQVLKRLRRLCRGNAEGVHVRIDQPRDDRAAASVDHACRAADVSAHLVGRPHGDEPPVANGKGLRLTEPSSTVRIFALRTTRSAGCAAFCRTRLPADAATSATMARPLSIRATHPDGRERRRRLQGADRRGRHGRFRQPGPG